MNNEYEFEVLVQINKDEDGEQYLDILYESGCDDATIGIGRLGFISLAFNRLSPNEELAFSTAFENIKTAIPHAMIVSLVHEQESSS